MSGVVTVTGKPAEFPNDNAIESVFITVFDHSLKFGDGYPFWQSTRD